MTDQQAIQKMKEDLKLRGLAEGTFKNYARNVRKFPAFCNPRIQSTMAYLHLTNIATKGIISPADTIGTPND